MSATHLLYRHDDGRWVRAEIVRQWRTPQGWRVHVTYSTAPGFRFGRCEWADSERLLPDEQHDQPDHAGAGDHQLHREHEAAEQRTMAWLHA